MNFTHEPQLLRPVPVRGPGLGTAGLDYKYEKTRLLKTELNWCLNDFPVFLCGPYVTCKCIFIPNTTNLFTPDKMGRAHILMLSH